MKIAPYVSALTLVFTCNAWAELEILQSGIQLESADKPTPRSVGSVWTGMRDGQPFSSTIVSETDSTRTYEDSTGCTWTRSKDFSAPATSWANCGGKEGTAIVRPDGETFPLSVGKEWSYGVDGGNWRTDRDCEVEDAVRLKTGIGEHDAFKIVCTDKWTTRTRYYSPKLQTNVFTERNRRTKSKITHWEYIKHE